MLQKVKNLQEKSVIFCFFNKMFQKRHLDITSLIDVAENREFGSEEHHITHKIG